MFESERVVAVIRESTDDAALFCAAAAYAGGIKCLELTFGGGGDVPAQVQELSRRFPDAHIGVGTTMTLDQLRAAAKAGAKFAISPHTDEALIREARSLSVQAIPGALTPTEIVRAHAAGASYVKVFPISAVGGAEFLKHVRSAIKHIKLIPTGGIRVANAAELITAGAVAVGAATDLFTKQWVADRDAAAIRAQAERYVKAVRGAA